MTNTRKTFWVDTQQESHYWGMAATVSSRTRRRIDGACVILDTQATRYSRHSGVRSRVQGRCVWPTP